MWPSTVPGSTSGNFLIDVDSDLLSEHRDDFMNHRFIHPNETHNASNVFVCFV